MIRYQYPFTGGNKVTTIFGKPGSWKCGWHIGVDLVGIGTKKIHPIASGKVIAINAHGAAYGNHVVIQHPDGNVSLYAHMSEQYRKVGDEVGLDSLLGLMGATGHTQGAHLHLEIHRGGYRYPAVGSSPEQCPWLIDPMKFLTEQISLYKDDEAVPEVEQWQIDAIKEVCARCGISLDYWLPRAADPITVGQMFGILNKVL